GQWLILPFIAIIPIVEALSVLAQAIVGWLSVVVTGQSVRLLRATPLHHHFEVIGWSQVQIFQRFWEVQLLAATVGVALALL
ncbi:MAG: phospho-N-acetylmuramoyl-pentapeptide-transferase, partial [Anaerolineae bacterium]